MIYKVTGLYSSKMSISLRTTKGHLKYVELNNDENKT